MSLSRKEFLKLVSIGLGGALSPGVLGAVAAENETDAGDDVAMLYDTTLCIGCRACQTACRDWNQTSVQKDPSRLYDAPQELAADTWTLIQLYQDEEEQSFVKHQCMHCLHPSCASACPVHALEKRANGPVLYDPDRCIGCRYCMLACPFGVPRFEWDEVIPVIAKCTFCDDRLEAGNGPNCAEACPTGALVWGTRSDLLKEATDRQAASPGRYISHIYGEDDAGGTSVLYLSHVPFDNLGFPELGPEPRPELSEQMGNILIPGVVFGVPFILAGIRYVASRRHREEG